MAADEWEEVAAEAGRAAARAVKGKGSKLGALWSQVREYLPPDVRGQADRALNLVALGFLPNDAPTDAEIGDRFKQIARECHPDKTTDEDRRARYVRAANARDALLKKT